MIQIIYGAKGTGKTKQLIDRANKDALESHGEVVFLADTNRYMYDLRYVVRFVNVCEYEIQTEIGLLGFIRGILAGNKDVKSIYIDGAHRMTTRDICDMTWFYNKLEELAQKNDMQFILSVSAPKEELPDFIQKYID